MKDSPEKTTSSGLRITRRDVGVALASGLGVEACRRWIARHGSLRNHWPFAAKPAAGPKYTGALNGFEDKVDLNSFNPAAYTLRLHDEAPLRMTFQATTRAEAEVWQKALRAKLLELIGGFPEKREPLRPQTLEVRDFPEYRREKFTFESRPGFTVLGYLLTPKSARAPYPAVIALPGHGRGVDDLVAIDREGRDRVAVAYTGTLPADPRDYQYDYAVQAVRHGMAAVAIEPLGFGCRRDPTQPDSSQKNGLYQYSCYPWASAALLLGQTAMAWRVYDVVRTIDWIETRKELDSARVGCMGISNGGECTIYAAALDTRIRAAFASGSLNTFRDSLMSYIHCIDGYVPGILNWAELYDIAGLTAPRAFFAESGTRDAVFPVAGGRASFERVRKIYEVFGVPDMAGQEVFEGPHLFCGRRGLPFLARQLA
jgi:dienelactone hydrolase